MREFFQGWRRKAGLTTLAMALLLFTAWMRSYVFRDRVFFPGQQYCQTITSHGGSILWDQWLNPGKFDSLPIEFTSFKDLFTDCYPGEDIEVEWRMDWAGFAFGKANPISDRMAWWIVPYWALVLPLTLLSAWLLLIKPRPAKSAKESSHA